jgi:hypothetical protein
LIGGEWGAGVNQAQIGLDFPAFREDAHEDVDTLAGNGAADVKQFRRAGVHG